MQKIILKIKTLLLVLAFIRKNPKTAILGGPPLLRIIGVRYQRLQKSFYSQAGQDAFLLMQYYGVLVKPEFPQIFIDVGCNHPIKHNNSYLF